jgi:hypothetical protein
MVSLFFQNTAHGGAPDLESTRDCGFADARAEEATNLLRIHRRCWWSSQPFPVFPSSVSQTGADTFAQDLPLELGEHGK